MARRDGEAGLRACHFESESQPSLRMVAKVLIEQVAGADVQSSGQERVRCSQGSESHDCWKSLWQANGEGKT